MSKPSITACADAPSSPCDADKVSAPSAPVYTRLFAIYLISLFERHRDGHEVDAEGGTQDCTDQRAAGNLILPGRRNFQRVAGELLILQHGREEAVERAVQRL